MRILNRYLTMNFLNPFVYCLLLFLFLYIIIDLFGHLDEILKARTAIGSLLQYYLSFVPIIFVQTTPLAGLLAASYSIGNLKKNSEITAMRACGLSVWRISTPFLICGLAASLLIIAINDRVVPKATLVSEKIKEEQIEMKTSRETQGVLHDVTLYQSQNRMFYIKTFDTRRALLKDIIILAHDQRNVIREKIIAKSGRWINGEWIFYEAIVYRLGTKGQILGEPQHHTQLKIPIPETPEEFTQSHRDPALMNFTELSAYIRKLKSSGYRPVREVIALHGKIATPFITLVAVLLGIPAVLRTSNRGGGVWMGIVISICMGLSVYTLMAISIALGRAYLLPPWLAAWLPHLAFTAGGSYLLSRS